MSQAIATPWPRRIAAADLHRDLGVARRINAEVVTLAGWGASILMQFAHPLVAAGVADHSTFALRPRERWRRLRSTLDAMLALTFGSDEQVARAARGINAIHDRVHGRLPEAVGVFPAGARYSAHDPELLRWVHATMLDAMPRTYELYVGPLTPAEKDRYCLEASGVAPLLGIPGGYLPTDTTQLYRYLDAMLASGQIAVGRQARELASEILNPVLPAPAGPLLPLLRLPAIGLLPEPIREAYGFRWDPRQERALRLTGALTREALRVTPSLLRHWAASRRRGLTAATTVPSP